MEVVNNILSAAFFVFCLSACALIKREKTSLPEVPVVIGGVSEASSSTGLINSSPSDGILKEAPLSVSLEQAFYVGQSLNVKVSLRPKIELPSADILVRVQGLKDGELRETVEQRLSEIFPFESIKADQSAVLRFVLKSQDLSEFQILCSWGEDAHKQTVLSDKVLSDKVLSDKTANLEESLTEARGNIASEKSTEGSPVVEEPSALKSKLPLEFVDFDLETKKQACAKLPCDLHYIINGQLKNSAERQITDIVLAVGLAWAEKGQLAKPPAELSPKTEEEEVVELGKFSLAKGQSKKMRVEVDRAVPVVPGGAFLPYIRVLSFKEK